MISREDLPKNLEAESELLGLMIKNSLIMNDALSKLKKNDFFLNEHQIIFEIIYELSKKQEVVNEITIWDSIKIKKKRKYSKFSFFNIYS